MIPYKRSPLCGGNTYCSPLIKETPTGLGKVFPDWRSPFCGGNACSRPFIQGVPG